MADPNTPIEIPAEFIDPEGDAELNDPRMLEEASTSDLRRLWADWGCREGAGEYADPTFFGRKIGGVPTVAVDAYFALEAALRVSGYSPKSSWSYNCRTIAGTDNLSLHSYGVAIDLDPVQNPYSAGDKYSGLIKANHVEAVLAIRNSRGDRLWAWGGDWKTPDRMHFQLDRGPVSVDVDWSTVPGGRPGAAASAPRPGAADGTRASQPGGPKPGPPVIGERENVLTRGSSGEAVTHFQRLLQAWDPNILAEHGADGDYGSETVEAVKKFQEAMNLSPTGSIDGVTATLLAAQG